MVKFNPKVANKFANRAARRANESKPEKVQPTPRETEVEEYRRSIQRLVNISLFGINDPIVERHADLFAYIGLGDAKRMQSLFGVNYQAAADQMVDQAKTDYVLYLDDERLPDTSETPNIGSCIVVRDVASAKKVVERLGCPEFMHLDYCLYSTDVSTPFITWFIDKFSKEKEKIHKEWGYHVHSMSDDGQRLLNRLLRSFERWNDKDTSLEELQAEIKEIMENPRFNPQAKRTVNEAPSFVPMTSDHPSDQPSFSTAAVANKVLLDATNPPDLGAY